ncbi:MAG: 50S ribosomal protein L9 [Planctomycetia bacterium]|nr:50S ribosomal protein L9 [Planctomycetia bacterium]
MKVLLRKRIENLGDPGDVVDVAEGHARNYLLTQHLAVIPTEENIRRVEQEKTEMLRQEKQRIDGLKSRAQQLSKVSITVKASANELGHLFGSVNEKDIADALAAEGFEVEQSQIQLAEPIRTLDRFRVPVRLDEGIEATIDLWVVPE